ncbi:uncharacterized protein EI97DRAFT_504088 [Westerdykella ornata]|uniref:Protein kinase domain-containing protein n=1 Tax=Westerdykella ornata TaxID=318751 RepID=A0A6A6J928_WESOR|nr:uncharacterized protein EI97DRAFT_504088 [Westerdykella ornata]KAF2272704.1 hypothetical protein EI97DRAFT_504088 [Westerdykella ornata]
MARTVQGARIQPSATGKRPIPIPRRFCADLYAVYGAILDDESIILVPHEYAHDQEYADDPDGDDAGWRREHYNAHRCQQATVVYERLGQNHPNLLSFLRRDPWTAFPILATPSGQPLPHFLHERKAALYTAPLDTPSARILPAHRPMMYEWALNLISALAFIHSHDIVFGLLTQQNCWVSTEQRISEDYSRHSGRPRLFLFGFVDAGFDRYPGSWVNSPYCYHDDREEEPTQQTDLYLYGCLLYEFMVGVAHDTPLQWDIGDRVKARQWPSLETEYMGDIVRKCWTGEVGSAEEVKLEVEMFVRMYGEREW